MKAPFPEDLHLRARLAELERCEQGKTREPIGLTERQAQGRATAQHPVGVTIPTRHGPSSQARQVVSSKWWPMKAPATLWEVTL